MKQATPEFSGYMLTEVLHATASGILYVGRSARGRPVWMYVYHLHVLEDPALKLEIVEGAKQAATLRHAQLARVKEVIETPRVAVVFEAPGAWLLSEVLHEAQVRSSPFSEGMAVLMITDICKGLTYLHAKADRGRPLELHHGTLAPHFVAVDPQGHAKILDVGLGRVSRSEHIKAVMVDEAATYLAPEQQDQKTTRASDIFSLGLILHHLIANRPALKGRDLAALYSTPLEAPEAERGPINASLRRVLMKALALEPKQRYPYARMLQSHLQSWVATHVGRRSKAGLAEHLALLFDDEPDDPGVDADSAAWDLDRIPTGRIDKIVRPTLPKRSLSGPQQVDYVQSHASAPEGEDSDVFTLNSMELDELKVEQPRDEQQTPHPPAFGQGRRFPTGREAVVFGEVDAQFAVPTSEQSSPAGRVNTDQILADEVASASQPFSALNVAIGGSQEPDSQPEASLHDAPSSGVVLDLTPPAISPAEETPTFTAELPRARASAKPTAPREPEPRSAFPVLPLVGVAGLVVLFLLGVVGALLALSWNDTTNGIESATVTEFPDEQVAEHAPVSDDGVEVAGTQPKESEEGSENAESDQNEGEEASENAKSDQNEGEEASENAKSDQNEGEEGSENAKSDQNEGEEGSENAKSDQNEGEEASENAKSDQNEGEEGSENAKSDQNEGEEGSGNAESDGAEEEEGSGNAESDGAEEGSGNDGAEEGDDTRPAWKRNGQGLLVVHATPRSTVRLNGRRVGKTPAYLVVKPGKYKVTIQNPRIRRAVTKSVRVQKEKRRVIRHKFK